MANGKHSNLMYFLSPDLLIKIVQKSAKPPNMQHHMLPTFSDTTVRRVKKGGKKEKETNVSLLKTVSIFSLIFQDWGQRNAVLPTPFLSPSVNVRAQARV